MALVRFVIDSDCTLNCAKMSTGRKKLCSPVFGNKTAGRGPILSGFNFQDNSSLYNVTTSANTRISGLLANSPETNENF